MSLRVGVIGLAFLGAQHSRIYADHPAAELVALCNSDAGRLQDLNALCVNGFTDFEAILAMPSLDAVSICLPAATQKPNWSEMVDSGRVF